MSEKVKVKGVSMFPSNWEKVKEVMRDKGFDSLSQTLRHMVKSYGEIDVKLTAVKGA